MKESCLKRTINHSYEGFFIDFLQLEEAETYEERRIIRGQIRTAKKLQTSSSQTTTSSTTSHRFTTPYRTSSKPSDDKRTPVSTSTAPVDKRTAPADKRTPSTTTERQPSTRGLFSRPQQEKEEPSRTTRRPSRDQPTSSDPSSPTAPKQSPWRKTSDPSSPTPASNQRRPSKGKVASSLSQFPSISLLSNSSLFSNSCKLLILNVS